jgi:hypothetical protein
MIADRDARGLREAAMTEDTGPDRPDASSSAFSASSDMPVLLPQNGRRRI